MKKQEIPLDPNEPAFVPGRKYLFTSPGGFTLRGQYVCELGLGAHRFQNVSHLRNAGGLSLPEICVSGPGPETQFVSQFPRYWNGTPIWWADYFGEL